MLEEKDIQTIGKLLDEKLDDKFDEMATLVNKGFTDMQKEFDGLKEELKGEINGVKAEIKLRPTLNQIMSWGDKNIVDLELRADRHDYLHIDELDKLPPQAEISRALVEKGLKPKLA